jgi:hypothetical protein
MKRDDVVGRMIIDVLVSQPDKPINMSDTSESKGYLKLDSDRIIQIDGGDLIAVDPLTLKELIRDTAVEKEFTDALGRKILDTVNDGLLVHVLIEGGISISTVPGQFWVRPYLERNSAQLANAKSIW